ncbi:late embryogenesis abundant protein D-34-like isoform X1 [Senna tora]|uniref:Late embryogenesis abundant protein D-34-like isoform X1 n=1 Tax=Senna tora TaxID=362788 RepID=A0A834TBM7_9FABA|nr:late embryogenesis abundant protein D-34-like isoform X1 [Senna tora]
MSQEQARRGGKDEEVEAIKYDDVPNRNTNLNLSGADRDAVNQITSDAASMQPPPGFKATQDFDFISHQTASLNPPLLPNQNNDHTLPYLSSGNRETGEGGNNNVISGIPGGMAASMASADHRVTKNNK